MVETNYDSAVTVNMNSGVPNFSVDTRQVDGVGDQKETTWMNTDWTKYFGYYKKIPELKKAIDALAIWVLGKGWTADPIYESQISKITGWGEDTFNSIMWNMLVIKKVNGDAYAQIIRNKETGALINIKPLDPGSIRIVANGQGRIKRYEQINKIEGKNSRRFKPNEILHLCNDRVADEIHGVSIVEACEKVILARNEAIEDWQTVLHRNVVPFRIIEVDFDDPAKMKRMQAQYTDQIKNKTVMVVPKGNVEVKESTATLQDSLTTIKYYENFFYQAVGIPKIILGGSEEFTEASSKIGYLTFEQIYRREQVELEADLWNQLAIRVKFVKPASLQNELLSDEGKDTENGAAQPNDTEAGVGQ